jgi:tyramine---L-glutamate ligase
MKLLVLEYATATGLDDPSITAEGHSMLYGLLEDLKDFETYHLIPFNASENYDFPSLPIKVHGDLKIWLHKNIQYYDACILIAPEENNILYDLTCIIEDKGVEILGSSSNAVKSTTNKFEMYNLLKGKFPLIKTEKAYFMDSHQENTLNKDYFKSLFKNNLPKVIKPADGVSCSGICVVKSSEELIKAHDYIKRYTKLPYFIIQDYVSGVNVSVSLLSSGVSAVPLSLNLQDVQLNSGKINYNGGKVPFKHRLSDLAMEISRKAVESIEGLKGYIGVDMILENDEDVRLIEINSRLTTPYVGLRKIVNFNLGEAIINSVNGELPSQIKLNGRVNFYKEGKTIRISVLK